MKDSQVFDLMKKEIEEQSQKEIDAIMAEVKAMEDEAITSVKKEAQRDAEIKLKQELEEINSVASTEISESHAKRTKKLINKRDEYVKNIFTSAQEELIAFTKTDEYKLFMINKVKKAAEEDLVSPQLKLRKEDLALADDLKKAYGKKVDVVESDEIVIGGFLLEDPTTSLVINDTLEFALSNQKSWFASHSGLIIK